MLKIWGRINSSNVQKVLWTCDTLNIPYERIEAGMHHGVNNSAQYREMNPNGRIPTIDDDGFVLWESNAIVRYLCAKHDSQGLLMPLDLQARANADRWMDWATSTLAPAITPLFWQLIRPAPTGPKADQIASAREETSKALAVLDHGLRGKAFVAGDAVSMGDIPCAIQVYRWFEMLGVEDATFKRPDYKNLAAWYARLHTVPQFKKWVAIAVT